MKIRSKYTHISLNNKHFTIFPTKKSLFTSHSVTDLYLPKTFSIKKIEVGIVSILVSPIHHRINGIAVPISNPQKYIGNITNTTKTASTKVVTDKDKSHLSKIATLFLTNNLIQNTDRQNNATKNEYK